MCPTYRCPIDETVFQTSKIDRAPTMEGHPECPGPVCAEKFGTKPAPQAQGGVAGKEVSALQPPPAGQGW